VDLAAISLVLSLVALASSIFFGTWQLRLSRHANSVPVLIGMLQEWRSPEFAMHRDFVANQLPEPPVALTSLTEPALTHARSVAHFFDNLGVLVRHNVIDEAVVLSYLGRAVLFYWGRLEPFIEVENTSRGGGLLEEGERYQSFFHYLALRAGNGRATELRKRLALGREA